MNTTKVDKIFCVVCFIIIVIPLLTVGLNKDTVSIDENRTLSEFPQWQDEDGNLNTEYLSQFEEWFSDHQGLRNLLNISNARIMYYVFNRLPDNTDMYLGPKGELNYATEAILYDYAHANKYTDDELNAIAWGYQVVSDYLENQGIQFYYFQCWDKHSIYPEQFPDTVYQYGEYSKTDEVIKRIADNTSVKIINPKPTLFEAKGEYKPYGTWNDPTHWTQRGSYIGYLELMKTINENNNNAYHVLSEGEYDIETYDQGKQFIGGIHREDILEQFKIKDARGVRTDEKLTLLAEDDRHSFMTNDEAGNSTRLMVLCDSYFYSFLTDDFAESFNEVVTIQADYIGYLPQIIDAYRPDIVVLENAERVDRSGAVVQLANSIYNN